MSNTDHRSLALVAAALFLGLCGCVPQQMNLVVHDGFEAGVTQIEIANGRLRVAEQPVTIRDEQEIARVLSYLADVTRRKMAYPQHDLKLTITRQPPREFPRDAKEEIPVILNYSCSLFFS